MTNDPHINERNSFAASRSHQAPLAAGSTVLEDSVQIGAHAGPISDAPAHATLLGSSMNWRARCAHSLYVGEVEAVIADGRGVVRALMLDAGITFSIPLDIRRAAWDRLSRGDLVCVRWNAHGPEHVRIALSVDAMDGRISIVSACIIDFD
jgi:hypothetical protein